MTRLGVGRSIFCNLHRTAKRSQRACARWAHPSTTHCPQPLPTPPTAPRQLRHGASRRPKAQRTILGLSAPIAGTATGVEHLQATPHRRLWLPIAGSTELPVQHLCHHRCRAILTRLWAPVVDKRLKKKELSSSWGTVGDA
jgi:hypothetical protein